MPIDPPCWLRKVYLGVSAISAVGRFLFSLQLPDIPLQISGAALGARSESRE